jgi:hypothetical protein
MKIEIEINPYSKGRGLVMPSVPGGTLRVVMHGDTAAIEGDRDGFETLARALLTMVHSGVGDDSTAHIHLDPRPVMSEGSMPVVVQWLR